jgi:hypothetical protein
MNDSDIQQLLKVNTLEAQVLEMSKKIDNLSKALLDHMDEENAERKATDKKLNLHTILLIVVGFGATGTDVIALLGKFAV